jgi:hypothetical protein
VHEKVCAIWKVAYKLHVVSDMQDIQSYNTYLFITGTCFDNTGYLRTICIYIIAGHVSVYADLISIAIHFGLV